MSIHPYLALAGAILFDLLGTSFLKASEQFTRPVPTTLMIICTVAAFFFLSLALKTISIGIAYAVWSGVGIGLVALVGSLVFNQKLDLPALTGIGLIVVGVVLINGFSRVS